MSYPYGGGGQGGYPQQGPPGGFGGAPGYPQAGGAPGGAPGYPQQGYQQQPQMGMPTAESASAAAYGQPQGGLPYGSAPPGGAPGQMGFGMGGAPPGQPGYPQPPGVSMPQAPGAGQPTYQQNPSYNTPMPPAGGYNQPPAAGGYPGQQPGAAFPGQQPGAGFPGQQPAAGGYPGTSAAGYPGSGAPGYPGQQPAQGQQPAPGQPPAPGYGAPGQGAPGHGAPGQPSAPGGYGGYQGQAGQAQPGAPGGMGYQTPSGGGTAQTGYRVREDPTLKPHPNFNAESDAKILRKAMKGFGTDEKAIIDILAYRTNDQRQEIKHMFKTCYGRDIINDLKSELGGHFEDVIIGLMMKKDEYDAYELKRAMRGMGTDEDAMIEIMCSRNNRQIQEINLIYKTMYRQMLEKDIVSDTSGHFKRLMVSMANGHRQENQNVDMNKAQTDAQALFQAGEKRWGTDESQFNIIMASQSYEQMRAVFDAYSKISGRDIETVVKNEMSGNLELGMLAIIKCVRNRPAYFAEKLYKSMKGAGTDDRSLIRVIVTRAEVDMVQIKQEFQKAYGQSLDAFIRGDISGDYRRMVLAMVGAGQ